MTKSSKDLQVGKDLKLADVEAATGISTSTLQRIEADADIRVGYQDIVTLSRYYDASVDYFFGLTDYWQAFGYPMKQYAFSKTANSTIVYQ